MPSTAASDPRSDLSKDAMLAQSPLSADPDLHAGIATRLDDIVAIARDELGDSLKTILLGGSLA